MTTNPFPYNITLPSGTASIRYRPFRDGDPNAGWNVSYPSGTKLYSGLGGTQGIGAGQSQTTFPGATIEFEWIGMAIYLYGTASSSDAYQISIDSQDIGIGQESESGLLGSKTGLVYGQHSVTLLARGGGEVVFRNAVVTIGMRRSSEELKTRSVIAASDNSNFFQYSPGWVLGASQRSVLWPNGTSTPLPFEMLTTTEGSTLSFTITNASAFFLWGTVNADHTGQKEGKLISQTGETRTTVLSDVSSILDFRQIMYWESGLDYSQNYTVEVRNVGNGSFGFHQLDIVDDGSFSLDSSKTKAKALPPGAITGIAIGTAAVIIILIASVSWWYFQRSSRKRLAMASASLVPEPFEQDLNLDTKIGYTSKTSKNRTHYRNMSRPPSSPNGTSSRHLRPIRGNLQRLVQGQNRIPRQEDSEFSSVPPPEYDIRWATEPTRPLPLISHKRKR